MIFVRSASWEEFVEVKPPLLNILAIIIVLLVAGVAVIAAMVAAALVRFMLC